MRFSFLGPIVISVLLPAVAAAADPSGNPTWKAEGGISHGGIGFVVASAGDVNADGHDDVLVGAPFYNSPVGGPARAYLYLGSPAGPESTPAWILEGDQLHTELGFSLASAGDLNGDGFGDVVIGEPRYLGAYGRTGRVLVFHGSAAGLAADPSVVLEGLQPASAFGNAVASAGDLDGDGFDDLAIGAPYYRTGDYSGPTQGRVYVFMGSAQGVGYVADLTLEPGTSSGTFGFSLASAGDTNGDGFDDLIVGNHFYDSGSDGTENTGRAYLYLGSTIGLSAAPSWTAQGAHAGEQFGMVGPGGDFNSDGFADIVVGGPLYSTNPAGPPVADFGRAIVFAGSAAGLGANPSWLVQGPEDGSYFGVSVTSARDVNDDGFDDVLVGAVNYTGDQYQEGLVSVFLGSASGPSLTPAWTSEGNQAAAQFAGSVASAGDVNADGMGDVIVGARWHDNGQTNEGAAFVFAGSSMDNRPPVAHAGVDLSAECSGPAGASVTLDGSASSDLDSSLGTNDDIVSFDWFEGYGTASPSLLGSGESLTVALALGVYTVTLVVTDLAGAQSTDEVLVTVADTAPPSVSVGLAPSVLWPPNHRMVGVSADVAAIDTCGVTSVVLSGLTSNEPDDAPGGTDGRTIDDIRGAAIETFDTEFELRAERDVNGDGRVYTVSYVVTDGGGHAVTESAEVLVPHDQGGVAEPLLLSVDPSIEGTVVRWLPVPGASAYNVIRGSLADLGEGQDEIHLGNVTCLASGLSVTETSATPDPEKPPSGLGYFYLVEYIDGMPVSYGTVTTAMPRVPSGACP